MKSFGVFLKRDVDENEVCLKCPHHKSVEQSLASEKDTVKEDLELQINLWNSEVRCTATNEKYRFRAIDFGIVFRCLLENWYSCFLSKLISMIFWIW